MQRGRAAGPLAKMVWYYHTQLAVHVKWQNAAKHQNIGNVDSAHMNQHDGSRYGCLLIADIGKADTPECAINRYF